SSPPSLTLSIVSPSTTHLFSSPNPATTSPLFFFTTTATTAIYTLSLHDALPISQRRRSHPRSLQPGASWRRRRHQPAHPGRQPRDRKSTRLNSSHVAISYAVFCLKKKN